VGSNVSSYSFRNLPSPSEIKGTANILLMPFYQETELKDSNKIDDEQTGGSKLKILDDLEPVESDTEIFDDL
jgi:hypothetical protein